MIMNKPSIQHSPAGTLSPGIAHSGRLGLLALAAVALVTVSAAVVQGQALGAVGTAGSV